MRWTILRCVECGQQVIADTDRDTGVSYNDPGTYYWHFHGEPKVGQEVEVEEVEVVPASFTDSDVERVAKVLNPQAFDIAWAGPAIDEVRERARKLARAALSAYLEPTTKKET